MPSGPDARRLVAYVPAAQAEEIARRARLDGRTVSGWLARLIADTLGSDVLDVGPAPADTATPAQTPNPPGESPRRAPDDPEYAEWLRRNPGRR